MCVEHCHHLLLPSWAVVNPLNCWYGGLVQPSWQDPLVHQTPPVHTSVEDARATHKCVWNITQVIIRIHLFSITVSRFLFKMAMHTTHLIFQSPHQQIYMWWASSIPFFPEVKTTMSEWVRNSIQHSRRKLKEVPLPDKNLPEEHTGTSTAAFKYVALRLTHPLQGINKYIVHTLRTVITGWLVMQVQCIEGKQPLLFRHL